ncbi:creatininase family protein [Halalkalibacter kiskunsagensis]|uniref:Creatininase family protein n=1 Tax=Halalkalibacter kiskunsagensis TaxID=1548599 RepID=A0ABV6KD74_9BACI
MKAYILTEMTWEEVEHALKTAKMAIIPVGAHEQHGPHMVESCDAVLAEEMSKRLAERLFPNVIVAPTVNMGVSPHHMNFPGTISLSPDTLIAIIRDMIQSLKQHKIEKFLLLNSHGGNQTTLNLAITTLTKDLGVEIYLAKTTASAKEAMKQYIDSPLFGHSCEREVSEALYLAPHIVRFSKLEKGDIQPGKWKMLRPGSTLQGYYNYEEMTKNGCIGDATKASIEMGEAIVEEALGNLTEAIETVLETEAEKIV